MRDFVIYIGPGSIALQTLDSAYQPVSMLAYRRIPLILPAETNVKQF